jgi:3D (Asp-Asp-Asp) domain-containing protein
MNRNFLRNEEIESRGLSSNSCLRYCGTICAALGGMTKMASFFVFILVSSIRADEAVPSIDPHESGQPKTEESKPQNPFTFSPLSIATFGFYNRPYTEFLALLLSDPSIPLLFDPLPSTKPLVKELAEVSESGPVKRNAEEPRPESPSALPTLEAIEPRKLRVRLTFYSGQTDQWGSRVAWPQVRRAAKGRTAAADPKLIPYGTWIQVPGFGKLRVEDTGTAVKSRKASGGKHPVIDVYVGTESEVWRFAKSTPEYVTITVL